MTRRLYRSSTDTMIGGVCGGLGEFLGIDPMLVRIAFAVFALFDGLGIMAYTILWIVVPQKEQIDMRPADVVRENIEELRGRAQGIGQDIQGAFSRETSSEIARRRTLWAGGALVLVGIGILLKNLGLLQWLNLGIFWAVVIVAFGVVLLLRAFQENRKD